MNIIKNMAFFFVLLLVFALPTDGPDAPGIAGMSLVKVSGLMAFALIMVRTTLGGSLHVMSGFHMTVLLYVAWVILSYVWTEMPVPYETTQAINSSDALRSNFYLLMITLIVFQVANSSDDLEKFYIAAVLGAFWLVFMMVSDYKVTTVRQEIKGFEAGVIAVHLAMVMPMAISLLTQSKQWIWRLLGLFYLPAAMFTILITGSRTGSIVMTIGLFGFFPIVKRAGLLGKAASVLIVIIALVVIANTVPQKTIERIFTTGKEISSGTLNERRVIWDSGYEEWAKSPILGHGVGSFRRIVNSHNVDYTAHSSYVTLATEQGVVGIFLLFAVMATAFLAALRLPGDDRYLMVSMLLTVAIGQLSLTLQTSMFVWFSYALAVLNFYIKNKSPDTASMT